MASAVNTFLEELMNYYNSYVQNNIINILADVTLQEIVKMFESLYFSY